MGKISNDDKERNMPEYEAEDVYESFQNPEKYKVLLSYLLSSGLLFETIDGVIDWLNDDTLNRYHRGQINSAVGSLEAAKRELVDFE